MSAVKNALERHLGTPGGLLFWTGSVIAFIWACFSKASTGNFPQGFGKGIIGFALVSVLVDVESHFQALRDDTKRIEENIALLTERIEQKIASPDINP